MAEGSWAKAAVRDAASRMRADGPFYLGIALYSGFGLAMLAALGASDRASYAIYYVKWAALFLYFYPVLALLTDTGLVIHRVDRRRKLAFRAVFTPARLGRYVAGSALLMAFVFFQGTFTSIKNVLVVWQGGFTHDAIHADIDRLLHFGVDPWRLVEPLVAHPLLRTLTEFSYDVVWFVFCFTALYVFTVSPRTEAVRARYLVAFALTWVLIGNVLAGLYLSAGPAFFGGVTGDEARFGELVAHLSQGKDGHFSAAFLQSYLWKAHVLGKAGFGTGISAFPSVHVGLIAMNALFAFEFSRRLGIALSLYTLFIMASSVALGWHYAIDGYASVAIVAALHFALRRTFAVREGRKAAATHGLAPVTAS